MTFFSQNLLKPLMKIFSVDMLPSTTVNYQVGCPNIFDQHQLPLTKLVFRKLTPYIKVKEKREIEACYKFSPRAFVLDKKFDWREFIERAELVSFQNYQV